MEIDKLVEKITREVLEKVLTGNKETGTENRNIKQNMDSGSKSLASMIDHTLLKPEATVDQIKKVCQEARDYKFASVCVNTWFVQLVSELLQGSGVKTCCVVGFPLGAMSTRAKVAETLEAIENGANEVDMVVNVGAVKSGRLDIVKNDIEAIVNAAKGKALVKVIIETCLLTDDEKVKVCTLAKIAGADYVKTSTGFSTGGATVEDVKLMRQTVGPYMGVKASGGVRDYQTAVAMINAGATRLGTSSGIAIVKNIGIAETETNQSPCIKCGNCTKSCPTGNTQILKLSY